MVMDNLIYTEVREFRNSEKILRKWKLCSSFGQTVITKYLGHLLYHNLP